MLVANSTLGKAHNTTCSSAPKYVAVHNIIIMYSSGNHIQWQTLIAQQWQCSFSYTVIAAFVHSDHNIYTTTVGTAKFLLLCIDVAVVVCKC